MDLQQAYLPGLIGMRYTEASKDRLVAELTIRDDLRTVGGALHGGAIMALADTVGATATFLNLPPGASTTTLESKTNFFAAGRDGVVRAEAIPLHRGRTTMVWQTRVTDSAGRLLAQTFATIQPVAPLYSTLLQIDPYSYPNVVGDVASEWKISPDGLTYTFKIRQDIRFHDGSPLTAADVKASYDKILNPPEGVRSIRKHHYSAVASVEAPDPATVVFKLKFPSASLLANLASPSNVIFPKKYLDKDPNYFKNNVMGSGPFRFKSYTRGATFEGERNPDYFIKDRPYLNGYKFFISTETSVRAAAIRSGRAHIEFRDLPQAEVDAIRKQLGDKIVVQQTPFVIHFDITINNTVKPFTDARVRKALTLAIDRYTAGKVLHGLTGLRDVGALTRPGTEWAMAQSDLERFPGFARDAEKNRAEARRLLAEAGYPNGFKVVLKNRNVKLPYQDFAVYVLQEWRKIGVEAEHRPLETAAWYAEG